MTKEEEEEEEIKKVQRKVPKWFKKDKQHQINSRILLKFLDLKSKNRFVSFDTLKKKCSDMKSFHSNYSQMTHFGKTSNGKIFDNTNKEDIKLWKPVEKFIQDEYLKIVDKPTNISSIFPDEIEGTNYYEGAKKQVFVNIYERNEKARQVCIENFGYKCIICEFDFEKKYGEIGKNFIHVHHIKPLSEIDKEYKISPIEDLKPVCPNCHAMLHSKTPAFSINDIKNKLNT
ncbi:HNH endonuclease [uncultured Gammaproteobacteria bacterium]|nr:HNH endonuclease [uncultured Gammaproteobacteria bacterium]CAC9562557.1 HNH endonuclease [uncultured Gammaproteobacteria bacterium]CAC9567320.1 HNH endonuclease [uncultured Gammaproteobacteria bacterium]CAC9571869.1 HNH endonuclease [uncultured Gammaproteobacteria bacterium]CAC9572888.1 HNH endonuclease [uncultured Gammaproteobacteria bacterium]